MNLQARENMMRFFQTDEKKEEIISKAQRDHMQKTRNKDPFAIMIRVSCVAVAVAFVVVSFRGFSPPGILGNVIQAMMSIFLAMYLIGSAGGGAAMGGAEAAAVDGSADAGMEGDMGDDGGGEGGDEGGDDEGEEEEEEDEEGGAGKKGKGGGKGDSAKPLVVTLHTKVDQLMNAVVAVSKANNFPFEDLGFDDELLGVIEERLTTSSKQDDAKGPKQAQGKGKSTKREGLRRRAPAVARTPGGGDGMVASASIGVSEAKSAPGELAGSPAGEPSTPGGSGGGGAVSLSMLIAAKRKARGRGQGKTD